LKLRKKASLTDQLARLSGQVHKGVNPVKVTFCLDNDDNSDRPERSYFLE